jgi:ribosomal protein S8
MKTKSLFITALVIIGAFASAVGKDEPRNAGLAVVPVKGSEVFKVIYRGETAGKVKLNVYNSESKIIFSETLTSEGFIRPLNFTGLESGEYTVELIDATGKKVEKVSYKSAKTNKYIHISKLADGNKFMVAVANPGNSQINVRIFDAQNNLLHSEVREVSSDFAQLYSVKSLLGVTVEVSDSTGNVKTIRF